MSDMDQMPCGNCDCGTYAVGAVLAGLQMFSGIKTKREALKAAPRCKHDKHICFGARDFIVACEWPLDEAQVSEIKSQILA